MCIKPGSSDYHHCDPTMCTTPTPTNHASISKQGRRFACHLVRHVTFLFHCTALYEYLHSPMSSAGKPPAHHTTVCPLFKLPATSVCDDRHICPVVIRWPSFTPILHSHFSLMASIIQSPLLISVIQRSAFLHSPLCLIALLDLISDRSICQI